MHLSLKRSKRRECWCRVITLGVLLILLVCVTLNAAHADRVVCGGSVEVPLYYLTPGNDLEKRMYQILFRPHDSYIFMCQGLTNERQLTSVPKGTRLPVTDEHASEI